MASGPVLDVGCGPGHVTAHLAGLGVDVQGVDLSPRMVEHARRLHPGAPVLRRLGDGAVPRARLARRRPRLVVAVQPAARRAARRARRLRAGARPRRAAGRGDARRGRGGPPHRGLRRRPRALDDAPVAAGAARATCWPRRGWSRSSSCASRRRSRSGARRCCWCRGARSAAQRDGAASGPQGHTRRPRVAPGAPQPPFDVSPWPGDGPAARRPGNDEGPARRIRRPGPSCLNRTCARRDSNPQPSDP